jgi:hypothetical protein
MNKENTVYIENGILLSHKEKKLCHLQENEIEIIMLSEKNQTQKEK